MDGATETREGGRRGVRREVIITSAVGTIPVPSPVDLDPRLDRHDAGTVIEDGAPYRA